MGAYAGPDISEQGLVLALDGANFKSFKGEATTNLLSNGDFSSGLTSWSNYNGASASVINLFDIPPYLNTSKSAANSVTSATQSVGNYGGISKGMPTLTAGVTYTISYYARCLSGTLNLKFSNQNGAGDESNLSHSKTITTTWSKYTHTATLNIAKNILFIWNSSSPSNTFQITDIQIEAKSYSTTFTTGTRGTTVATGGGWADLTGNGNNGELVNGVRESADNLGSLSFDGTNDYVNAPLTKSASCTFSCWARTTTLAGNPMLFNAGPNASGPDLFFYNGKISWNTWNGDANPLSTTPTSVTNGDYHHYVVVNDALSNTKLYYDGVLLGTATYRTAANNTNLTIGGNTSSYMWNGNISNFTIHNRVLTENEIKQNFNALRGRFGI